MLEPALKESTPRQTEKQKVPRRYRFEWSLGQLVLYSLGLILTVTWMFIFGILVGRGIPLIDLKDTSYKAEFLRFLGLGRQATPPPENAAETWESPRKMVESLRYYQDLAGGGKVLPQPPSKGQSPPAAIAVKPSSKEADQETPATKPKVEEAPAAKTEKVEVAKAQPANGPSESMGEHFTLLIASLKDLDNAQKLLDQLKSKGYDSRLESLDLSGSGRWNRVLVGSFGSRDAAQRFAAEFNRKEHMEGLVIRESN